MKRIDNEQILDRIYDLADAAGLRIDDFMIKLEEDYGEKLPSLEGLPEDVISELNSARESKKEMRKQSRMQKSRQEASEEIKKFREIFPEVSPEDIPDSVWAEVEKGIPLTHAYALYTVTDDSMKRRAEEVNGRNSRTGIKANSDGSTEPVFTKERVERMSGKDVKNNYKSILRAMKNWKL